MTDVRAARVELGLLIDALPTNVSVLELVDGDIVLRAVNQASMDVSGYEPDMVLDKPLSSFQPRAIVDRIVAPCRECIESGEPRDLRIEMEVPAGRRVYAVRLLPLPDLPGPLALSVTTDLTAATEALASLEETQALARLGHWTWSPADDQVTWSSQLYDIFGVEQGQFEATFEAYLGFIAEEDREVVESSVQSLLEGGSNYRFRHRVIRPDGSVRHLEALGEAVRDDAGNVLRLAGTAQDITEQVELELEAAALRDAQRRHEQGLELNDDVMQGLATARVALMVDDQEEALDAIDRTMDAVRDIVHRLLSARIERAGALEPGDLVRSNGAFEESP